MKFGIDTALIGPMVITVPDGELAAIGWDLYLPTTVRDLREGLDTLGRLDQYRLVGIVGIDDDVVVHAPVREVRLAPESGPNSAERGRLVGFERLGR
uniref:Uncharacterized protein n=1 Tax=viral metagenome TaxID=1070528 RepID=A0A6H1Z8X3_9ZZZZ